MADLALASAAGRFIVLEGIDGSGTTTQTQALGAALTAAGVAVHTTQEPSTGPFGQLLRELLAGAREGVVRTWDCLALAFAADRLEHVAREVRPALERGCAVICDRYDLSSLAYQSASAPSDVEVVPWLRQINARALRPDLTLVLDVDPEVAERRRAARGAPGELFEQAPLQRRLAAIYRCAEELVPGDRVFHIDANVAEAAVHRAVLAAVVRGLAS